MAKRHKVSTEEKLVFGLIHGLWLIISAPFMLMSGNKKTSFPKNAISLEPGFVANKWQSIQELKNAQGPAHFRMAILDADKLFDQVLKSYGANGETFADRLRDSEKRFNTSVYQGVWEAHKVRNRLAHETETEVMSWEAGTALSQYEAGLREIGAL